MEGKGIYGQPGRQTAKPGRQTQRVKGTLFRQLTTLCFKTHEFVELLPLHDY